MEEEKPLFRHTSEGEPPTQKKLVLDQPDTPQFGTLLKSPFNIKAGTPLRITAMPTPSTSEQDNFRHQMAHRVLFPVSNRLDERTPSPKPKTPTVSSFTGQKLSSTPKQGKRLTETPHKKSVQKNLFSMEEEAKMEKNSRYYSEFTQLAVIGQGHFGTVYKCRNNFDNGIYAIKCVKNAHSKRFKDAAEAVNEVQALGLMTAKLQSKNIIRYYTAWKEDSNLYLLMEFCDFNLTSQLQLRIFKQEPFEESEIKKILVDVALGLRHLHDQHIIHLDIKPDNILFSSRDRHYKIADLGLSRQSQLKSGEDINEGDARYLAPEILRNLDQDSDLSKADIFSLGISIYELITLRELPKNGDEWHNVRAGKLNFGLWGSKYSEKLKKLIAGMMNPVAHKRPSTKEVLENDYLHIRKENLIKWERTRGAILRMQIDELHKETVRDHSR